MGDWVCLQLCEFQYDTVLCADARVLTEQQFIEALRQAGYTDTLQKNNAICLDVNKRAAMARCRAAHRDTWLMPHENTECVALTNCGSNLQPLRMGASLWRWSEM